MLPSGPAVDQLNWVLSQLEVAPTTQAAQLTSTGEITDHFGALWDPEAAIALLASLSD